MEEENFSNENQTRCPFCAEKINFAAKKCRWCGEIIDPALRMAMQKDSVDNVFSVDVRTRTQSADQSRPAIKEPKQRIVYILLGVFVGALGVHNFYAGYSGRAIAQLLIAICAGWLIIPLVAVSIWVIVEICTVTKDVDGVDFV